MIVVALLLITAMSPQDTLSVPTDAYANAATADLVQKARAARQRNEALVTAYTATVRERIGVGMHALLRDRMLFHQELAAKISWRRDSISTLEVIGAREGVPVASQKVRVPEDLRSDVADLVIDPAEDDLRIIGAAPGDSGFVYPLRADGERDYRYAIGDTTTITLPSGKKVRIVALQVIPRRADFRLMDGTLWFDADSYGLVRLVFRPAREFELRRDVDSADRKDVPGFVNVHADARYVTLEYGLYENRWWMPRFIAIDAYGAMGKWLNVPLRIERTYDDYAVEGGTPRDPNSTFRPAGSRRPRRRIDSLPTRDSTMVRDSMARNSIPRDSTGRRRRRRGQFNNLTIIVPSDTAALLSSPALGPPVLQMGDMISQGELDRIGEALDHIPPRPWERRIELPHSLGSLLSNARYNRIEALSLGARGQFDFGRFAVAGDARLGVADLVPNGDLSVLRTTPSVRVALTGYRRLAAANPEEAPFGPVNSIEGLIAQIDDGEYFRTLGAEATIDDAAASRWSVRVFYEDERPADVETQASLPHLFNGDRLFRPNFVADSATEGGAAVTYRGQHVMSATVRYGLEATVGGATGDFDYGKGSLALRLFVTPRSGWSTALSLSAGTSAGTLPLQAFTWLGGSANLRGYAGGAIAGPAFWFSRAEFARGSPAARLVLFGDAGWAGERSQFMHGDALVDAGVGGSFMDGLIRIDLARALTAPVGWRLNLVFNGLL